MLQSKGGPDKCSAVSDDGGADGDQKLGTELASCFPRPFSLHWDNLLMREKQFKDSCSGIN